MEARFTPLQVLLLFVLPLSLWATASGFLGFWLDWPDWLTIGVVVSGAAGWAWLVGWMVFWSRIKRLLELTNLFRDQPRPIKSGWAYDPIEDLYAAIASLGRQANREVIQLRQLDDFRREFLGDVSHELRTPIFAIQGYIETLLEGALDDAQVREKFLLRTRSNVDRLDSLVKDLLILSQLESGELSINRESFTLYNTVLDVFELLDYKRSTNGKSITFQVDANGLQQAKVVGDSDRIKQVLLNLVDNALKYGTPNGVIAVRLVQANDLLRIAVIDQGPGIAPEHLPHLFDRFYRVDKSRSRESGGTGLGLSIVKYLIEAHGQRIHVQSNLGQGTTFEFGLPLVSSNGLA